MDHRLLKDHDYALIDQAQLHESVGHLPITSLAPSHLASDAHLLPAVLALNELSDSARADLLDQLIGQIRAGQPPLCGCLLAHPGRTPAVVRHLKRRLIARQPAGQKVLLRFYDPRVFKHLRWILEPSQLSALLGGASSWTYLDRGRWRTVKSQPDNGYGRASRFTSKQWASIQRIGLINRAAARLALPLETDSSESGREIDGLLSRARNTHGLTDRDDLVSFAVHGMHWHMNFDRHPDIAMILREHTHRPSGYRDATALMRKHDWQRIVDELNNPERVQT